MSRLTIATVAAALTVMAASLGAQSKTITGETKTVSATVESIESATRSVTVKKADGTYEVFYVPAAIKKFEALKIGDTVTARYYENVVLTMKAPGEKAVDSSEAAVTRAKDSAAGTVAHQRSITATIAAIDPKAPSITFTGPNGWKYSTRVEDKASLAKVKVGDKVDITWTEAMVLSLDAGK
jgi:Cu/Ag efflux protein CusF